MKLSTQILLAFSLIILLSVADSYTNYRLSVKVQRNSQFLSKSEAVIRNSNKTHRAVLEMQSAVRGFLLSSDTAFLRPYYSGLKNVPRYLKEQHALIDNNKIQRRILDSVSILHKEWLTYTAELISARKENPKLYQSLLDGKLRKHVGKNINDSISVKFKRFDKLEYKTRKHHSEMLLHSLAKTRTYSLIFLSLTVIAGICSTAYIIVMITNRIKSMVNLADWISKGRFTIVRDTKKDELSALSYSLNIMSGKLKKNIHELENKNEELNKFAYVVSHDLKAPLRGIYNVNSWIEEDLSDEISPALRRYLNIIPQRTQRMEALMNGVLDYDRTNPKTAPEEVDTNSLIQEITQSIVPRNFTLKIQKLPKIFTERLKLEQVFFNLISNAVKYASPEKGFIEIGCRQNNHIFEFYVQDNGIGIDPQYHNKIFEIFQTLREKNEIESTGVGLAIVKKILDDRGETISIASHLGEGTVFSFTWRNNKRI